MKSLSEAGQADQEFMEPLQLIQQGRHPKYLPGDHNLAIYIYMINYIYLTQILENLILYDDYKLLYKGIEKNTLKSCTSFIIWTLR